MNRGSMDGMMLERPPLEHMAPQPGYYPATAAPLSPMYGASYGPGGHYVSPHMPQPNPMWSPPSSYARSHRQQQPGDGVYRPPQSPQVPLHAV